MANSAVLMSNSAFQTMLMNALCSDDDMNMGDDGIGGSGGGSGGRHGGDDNIVRDGGGGGGLADPLLLSEKSEPRAAPKRETCLISGEPLDASPVILECGHKFNYYNLFNEIYRQKKILNVNEIRRLKENQIMCPYCRNVQSRLLYWREGYPEIAGVNAPREQTMFPKKCTKVLKSGEICGEGTHDELCESHMKIKLKTKKPTKVKNLVIKDEINVEINAVMLSGGAPAAPAAVVENNSALVQITSAAQSEALETLEPQAMPSCCAILKYGKRAGLQCDAKVIFIVKNKGYCGRHISKDFNINI